jgi:RDD family
VSELVLPPGARLASRAQVAAAFALALLLFAVTLGIGYIAWGAVTWGQGQTPAQRILSLRCWLTQDGRVAGRDEMGTRQVLGLFLCGGLIWGVFVWLFSKNRRSAGDLLAGTVVLHDPDGVLSTSINSKSLYGTSRGDSLTRIVNLSRPARGAGLCENQAMGNVARGNAGHAYRPT